MKVGPRYKICRSVGDSVFAKCETPKFQLSKAKKQGKSRMWKKGKTEYGTSLLEKQKMRYTYNLSERQLANYVNKARAQKSKNPMHYLFGSIEKRLDNIIYRIGFVPTRQFARQVISHGHITVNGRRITIPSYVVKKGDHIQVREGSKGNAIFRNVAEKLQQEKAPLWVSLDDHTLATKITGEPDFDTRPEAYLDFNSVIEFYSRI